MTQASTNKLKISEVAKAVGVDNQTIRNYCKRGIIKCTRNQLNNYRLFEPETVDILRKIINGANDESDKTT